MELVSQNIFTRAAWLFCLCAAHALSAVDQTEPSFSKEDLARGKNLFVVHCARCHGMQGLGGYGPNLALPKLRLAPDYAAIVKAIANGIPGTNMPDAWSLSDREHRLIAGFVRSLGSVADTPLTGNPSHGRELFVSKGGCIACHTVKGNGGIRGPDLTEVGRRRGPAHLRQALLSPGSDELNPKLGAFTPLLPVRTVTERGETIEGVRLNEDAFTIQVRAADGQLHSFRKTELKTLNKNYGTSLMPSFDGVLAPAEIDDIVAYLAGLKGEK